uniref:Fasciclin-like arabinogalactan protein n=1 Tax=Micrasterias denticulata TaxID=407018 RepID=G4V4D6_9VIRI|nr:fasciclin-like arabinogalactan protein [Micrasterias denticulata]
MGSFQLASLLLVLALSLLSSEARISRPATTTLAKDLDAAFAKLAKTKGYSIISGTSYTSQVKKAVLASGVKTITFLAPNDAASQAAEQNPDLISAGGTTVVEYHTFPTLYTATQLSGLPANAKILTGAGSSMIKTSAQGKTPVKLKSPKAKAVATVIQTVYSGTKVVILGIDTVLLPA